MEGDTLHVQEIQLNFCLYLKWSTFICFSTLYSLFPDLVGKSNRLVQLRKRLKPTPSSLTQPFFFLSLFASCCSDIVVKAPQNLHMPNSSEESECAAKNAFQQVPNSQRGEEVVRYRPEAAYKRLLEACGRMPRKSN